MVLTELAGLSLRSRVRIPEAHDFAQALPGLGRLPLSGAGVLRASQCLLGRQACNGAET